MHVTHRLRTDLAPTVAALVVQRGASVFVAGSANKMPRDVKAALEEALAMASPDSETGPALFTRMAREQRWYVEAWS